MTDYLQGRTHELGASRAPTTADDADLGFDVGSLWLDRSAKVLYLCVDPAYGAADWDQVAKLTDVTASNASAVPAGTTVTEATTAHATDGATDNEFIDFDNASAATLTLDQGTAGHVVFASNRQNTVAAAAGSGVTLLGDTTTATTAAGDLLIARWLTATDVFVTVH